MSTGVIRAGIGGWTFEPWRGVFYPDTVKQKDELKYAASNLTSLEINGTYYSTFKPNSWMKWRDETPDWPRTDQPAADVTYARRMCSRQGEPTGMTSEELDGVVTQTRN